MPFQTVETKTFCLHKGPSFFAICYHCTLVRGKGPLAVCALFLIARGVVPCYFLYSQKTTSKQDKETTLHHSATLNTETLPNSASIPGPSKTTTSNILFPGAFSHRTRRTTAPVKDVTSASKKNSQSSADPNYQH